MICEYNDQKTFFKQGKRIKIPTPLSSKDFIDSLEKVLNY